MLAVGHGYGVRGLSRVVADKVGRVPKLGSKNNKLEVRNSNAARGQACGTADSVGVVRGVCEAE